MGGRRKQASRKVRSRSGQQTVESLRRALSRERERRKEALDQQTAISDILRAISSSPTDVRPVFDTILSNATRLCAGDVGVLWRYDGSHLRAIAHYNASAAGFAYLEQHPLVPGAYNPTPRAALERCVVHEVDVFANPEYRPLIPRGQAKGSKRSATQIAVPLLRQGTLLGVITVWRLEKRPFTDQQIALLKTFADQAAIAIENARLFNETKEALERQTATAEILKVISSSPTDVQPVFDAIVKTGVRLFHGMSVSLRLVKGDQNVRVAFAVGVGSKVTGDTSSEPTLLNDRSISGRAILRGELVHSADVMAEEWLGEQSRIVARRMGYRSVAAAPMLREGRALGVIGVTRADPGTFSDKELALLRTFADQAVIAIENVRLFNETKEALERQTATAEILKVIASSPNDIQPVLDAVAERATRLCDAMHSTVFLVEGDVLQQRAYCGERKFPADNVPISQKLPISRSFVTGRALIERRAVHVEDIVPVLDTEYPGAIANQRRLGFRTILAVPMLLNGEAIGTIGVWRREVRPFTEQEIGLLQTFADQAVIAIQNVRLFNETKEALERQTATSEILRVISSSTTDVQPVFETIARNAVALCGSVFSTVFRYDGELMHFAAANNLASHSVATLRARYPAPPDASLVGGRAILTGEVVRIEDIDSDPDYDRRFAAEGGWRRNMAVPMLRDGEPVGAIVVAWAEPGPIPKDQEDLLKTFADQAVIAIENVRLFKELQERTEALTKSVGQLTALGEVGQAISSTLDLETVLKTIVQRAVQLAGLDSGSIYEFDERDEGFHLRAAEHVEEEILEVSRKSPIRLGEGAVGRAGATREPVVVEDVLDKSYQSRVRELLIKSGSRAVLAVPLVRENLLLGALAVSRKSPGPFAAEVIDLLKTFATQSAVAIQNARLFNETREALDQQKASADVLAVISSSIADTTPVFKKILESCQRLFAGRNVGINVVGDDGRVHIGAYKGFGRAELEAHLPVPLSMESGSGAAILQRQVVHYPDCDAPGVPEYARRGAHIAGNRSVLFAPMLWEGKGVGAIFVGRPVTGPFSEKEIALLKTFADQAAIAIQNAKLFREIQEKSAQLEVANKHKSDFLANMSHELRTPLNAIIGFSEALIDKLFGDLTDKQLEYQKDIHQSGKHLLSLINDILDLSKIEAGRMELELSTFHLPTAVSNAVTLIRERALRHGIALGVEVDERLGEFEADERKVKQILLNLLSNAVKFTPDGGRVDVSAKLDTDKVEIAVKDTGVGIAPADQASLFEEFKQFGNDRSRKAEGTGLGLALTKRLVELHGGQISVNSAVGRGSVFHVTLPVRS